MNIEKEDKKGMAFSDFGLSPDLLKAIGHLGYESPSPIQEQTIPVILDGRDIIGQAQTGTGKTAAFSLPLLERIDVKGKTVQALILTPTRELAIQVAEAIHSYAKYLGRIKVLPVYGGQSISQQIRHLRSGVQIVVGTPGRVMDHIRRETLDIADLKMMVLDEADEMLRMGFIEDVEWILSHTPETRQTALFSATMPRQIRRIADRYLENAKNVEIQRKTLTVPTIQQFFINLSERQKTDALTRILEMQSAPGEAVLIFHRTKVGADQLTDKLQARGYAAEAMHGDMNQNQRENVIKRMKSGKIEIVVATDVAARGLDVEHITTVINYDMPSDTESYVHRIGRTGRAGREGKAVLFVTPRQQRMMRDIERYTKQKIEPLKLPTEADVAARREEKLKEKLTDTLVKQDLSVYRRLITDLASDSGIDAAELAAAAAYLAAGDRGLEVSAGSESRPFSFSEEGMVRLHIDAGRKHRISPGDIVGAIAGEAGIPGKAIGAIDVNDGFTLVDIPEEFVRIVLENMQGSRIRKQRISIRTASSDKANVPAAETGKSREPRKKTAQDQKVRKTSVKPKAKTRTKPKKKFPKNEGNNPFFGNFTKRKKKRRK
ncbi:MAG: DEAD/DEAH box helicase [Pyrinomonadaceae bacterium]